MRCKVFQLLILTFLALAGLSTSASADTTWVATGDVSGTWDATGNPYLIYEGDVTVSWFDSLEIEPGVVIKFMGDYAFEVEGYLCAAGTEQDSVYFTADTLLNPEGWSGLRFLIADDSCRLDYCVFEYGRANGTEELRYGGAVECYATSPLIQHCSFRHNYALLDGGAIYCRLFSHPRLLECEFFSNNATSGGAILIRERSSLSLNKCRFKNNTARSGGALHLGINIDAEISQCWFEGCVADSGGAQYCEVGSDVSNTNCVLAGNQAQYGGSVYLSRSRGIISFCTFYGNTGQGAHLFADRDSLVVENSIFAFSEGIGIFVHSDGLEDFRFNCLFGGSISELGGSYPTRIGQINRQNINLDPCDADSNIFIDPAFTDTASLDFSLSEQSHCHGASSRTADQSIDYNGSTRPLPSGSNSDIGAYESALNVSRARQGPLSGRWHAGRYLIVGDISIPDNHTLTLAPGTEFIFHGWYHFDIRGRLEAIGTEDDSIYFRSSAPNTPFSGLYFHGSSSGATLSHCVVSGVSGVPALYMRYSRQSLIEHSAFRLNSAGQESGGGLRFSHCQVDVQHCVINNNTARYGAGIYSRSGTVSIENCVIRENSADVEGGGVNSSNVTFSFCEIHNNSAAQGGGCYLSGSTIMENCNVSDNTAQNSGGGIYMYYCSPIISNTKIKDNSAESSWGGGVYIFGEGHAEFNDCEISGNVAAHEAGAFYANHSYPTLINCTIVDNLAEVLHTGGIRLQNGNLILKNCILANPEIQIYLASAHGSSFSFCDLVPYPNWDIVRFEFTTELPLGLFTVNANSDSCDRFYNIYLDPDFSNPGGGDYTLNASSPAIDAGDPLFPRDPDGSVCDLGAYPYERPFIEAPYLALEQPVLWDTLSANQIASFSVMLDNAGQNIDSMELTFHLGTSEDTALIFAGNAESINIDLSELDLEGETQINWWATAYLYPQNTTISSVVPYWFALDLNTILQLITPANQDTLSNSEEYTFEWELRPDTLTFDYIEYQFNLSSGNHEYEFATAGQNRLQLRLDSLDLVDGETVYCNVEAIVVADGITEIVSNPSWFIIMSDSTTRTNLNLPIPSETRLLSAYPNPFNAVTTIPFILQSDAEVRLTVFNTLGQEVATLVNRRLPAGQHHAEFNAASQPSGIYFYHLETGRYADTRKVILMK